MAAKVKSFPKSRARTAFGLLSEIQKIILAEPKRYDQTDVLSLKSDSGVGSDDKYFPSCGTVGCVAGWVAVLKVPHAEKLGSGNMMLHAEDILGISSEQADVLFCGDAAGDVSNRAAHAKRGARHIEKFKNLHAAQLKAQRV